MTQDWRVLWCHFYLRLLDLTQDKLMIDQVPRRPHFKMVSEDAKGVGVCVFKGSLNFTIDTTY